jgi:peptidoglycan/xylan/chitin deacetylase (PgdA/CDA1 family)
MRTAIKQVLFHGARWSGLNAFSRRLRRDSLVVLNYHGVLDEAYLRGADANIACNTVGSGEFAAHLEFLTRRYRPVRASDVEAWLAGQRELPPNAVLLTFDDGLRNNLTHAAPLLKRYGVPAILFLTTAYLGGQRLLWPQELYELAMRWPRQEIPRPDAVVGFRLDGDRRLRARRLVALAKTLPAATVEEWLQQLRADAPLPASLASSGFYAFLTWEEAGRLPGFGFELGSHTVNHWIVTRCTPEELRRELGESKSEIERRLGSACTSFCYPNGAAQDWSAETAVAVKAAGYRAAYALPDRIQRRSPVNAYAIDRLTVAGGVSQAAFEARVSGVVEAMRAIGS